MIKRSNKVKCYTIEEVQMIFIKESRDKSFNSFLNKNWIKCTSCGLMFKNRSNDVICSDQCEDYNTALKETGIEKS